MIFSGEKVKILSSTWRDHRMPILSEDTALFAFACSFFLAGSGVKAFHSLKDTKG